MARPARPGAHEALLDAARVEFARAGVAAARVEDVARRAGVSKGAFYLHFRTKEDAFRELLQRFLGALELLARRRQEATARFESRAGSAPSAAAQALLELEIRHDVELLEALWSHRHLIPAVDGCGDPAVVATVAAFRRRLRATTTRRIRQRQRAGHLRRDVDPAVVTDVVLGAYEDFGRRLAERRSRPDFEAWARALLQIVYQGIMTSRSPRPAPGSTP